MPEIIFYDGHCVTCSRWVRFVLKRDKAEHFHFAPLEGETFALRFSLPEREKLPESVIVLRRDGAVLVRSTAVLYVLWQLGGIWRLVAHVGMIVPRPLRDGMYRLVARLRPGRRKAEACPPREPALQRRLLP